MFRILKLRTGLLTILVVGFAAFLFNDLAPVAIIESVSSEQLITS